MKYSVSGHYLDEGNIKIGSYMEWYPSGSLFLMMHYLDGKLDGPACSFYENGQSNVKGIYKNGEKIGIFSYTMMSQNKPTTRYFNHNTNQYINAIDIGEPFRGLSELDSWIGFPYNSF
jgi:antitoxin component YwqK of YwqJK toxin-antitoxin module